MKLMTLHNIEYKCLALLTDSFKILGAHLSLCCQTNSGRQTNIVCTRDTITQPLAYEHMLN